MIRIFRLGKHRKGKQVSVLDSLKADFEKVIEQHRPEIEAGLVDAAKVVSNPVAEAVAGLVHIPPEALTGVAAALLDLDHELGQLKAAAKPAAETTQPSQITAVLGPDGRDSGQTLIGGQPINADPNADPNAAHNQ